MGCNCRERSKSEIVAGTSTRTSFFILMVAPSVSFALSDSSTAPTPLPPPSPPVYLFLLSPPSGILPWPLYPRSRLAPPLLLLSPFLLRNPFVFRGRSYPRCCAAPRPLESFLLSWRERLNSLRPLFAPVLLSSSPPFRPLRGYSAATDRRSRCGMKRVNISHFALEPTSLEHVFSI